MQKWLRVSRILGCGVLALWAALWWAAAPARAAGYQNEPEGFRGLKWGTPLAQAGKLAPARATGQVPEGFALYTKPGEVMDIGGAALTNLEYGFWNGRFALVRISFRGQANYQKLQKAAFKHFGKGRSRKNPKGQEFCWWGDKTLMILFFPGAAQAPGAPGAPGAAGVPGGAAPGLGGGAAGATPGSAGGKGEFLLYSREMMMQREKAAASSGKRGGF
ncbi:MAG: hypothetical protein KQJ78_04425 [Deltaproteobacteria bacterium]|nr:hypothetical protein [Deltaproteobacteria bacterium]